MTAVEAAPRQAVVGTRMLRKEDPRLIQGQASYVDDINLTGQLWAAWVRSPEAHAKIVSIDTSEAKAAPGVLAVFTGHDLDLQTFKLVDQLSGRMMGVRADITPQVARIDAHLLNREGVTRLCYAGPVLHARPRGEPEAKPAVRPLTPAATAA